VLQRSKHPRFQKFIHSPDLTNPAARKRSSDICRASNASKATITALKTKAAEKYKAAFFRS